jgi:glycosyltransferase involved in cell wall biosynthesis
MKILHLLASPVWSGPAENVALLALAQRAKGHEVRVAVDRKRGTPPFEEPSVPRLRALGLLDEGGLELCVKSLPWRMVADALTLRRRPVDVIHSHFSHDHYLARWGRPSRAILVRSIHAPRSLRGVPAAEAWTVPTGAEAERLKGRVLVLPPLVGGAFRPPVDRSALQRELGLEGGPVIGMVSTFQVSRRHQLGVAAFARLQKLSPGARWVLVGDGPLRDEIRGRVEAQRLERVTFVGYQSGEAFVRWLQALDVLWILGLGNDFSGRAAAQARACGVRVIAVPEGALDQLADELLPAPDAEAIAAATLRSTRREVELPSNEAIAERVLALYASCGARA